jgi:hypothetical protein
VCLARSRDWRDAVRASSGRGTQYREITLTMINLFYPRICFSMSVRRVSGMNRYFFHVACTRGMYMDENGRDFSDLKGAKAYAASIAAELARHGSWVGGAICIVNERGKGLDRVPIGSGWAKVVRTD